jgi:diguanylate cyclase (GGDEF)-like protein/PAS domain S-box-containing protein
MTTDEGVDPARAASAAVRWRRFAARHFHDYNRAAAALWLALVVVGVAVILWAASGIHGLGTPAMREVMVSIVFVAATACFPVHVPRSKYSIVVADVFVFSLLWLHGAPAAVAAAAVEGLIGAWRNSRRLTSRLSTPAVAATAMFASAVLFEPAHSAMLAAGATDTPSRLAALCLVTLPYFALSTLPLLAIVAAKNSTRVSLRDWFDDYSWFGALLLASGLVAGVLSMNAAQFGPVVIGVAACVALFALLFVNRSLQHVEAQRAAQEGLIEKAQREAMVNQQRFTEAFTHASLGMAIVGHDGAIVRANNAFCELLGLSPEAVLGMQFPSLMHPGDTELFQRCTERFAAGSDARVSVELRMQARGDGETWVSLHCGRFMDPAGDASCSIYQIHDITSRRHAEGQLHYIAYHDAVTDLANRNCFNERLTLAVERSRHDPGACFAVMFLDLDRFKVINDSLGHVAGNGVLREVACRLARELRPTDLLARLGGDEFAILVDNMHERQNVVALAGRLLAAMSQPLIVNGTELSPGASIGITFSDMAYRTVDEVLRDADLAMYEAKAAGRHRAAVFESGMHERVTRRLKLESELRRAIGGGQLSLVYQPLFDLEPRRLSGFEALARWVHPQHGNISPATFIALAEESGNISALTGWVLEEAVSALARWLARHPRCDDLAMHVNVSGRDIGSGALADQVAELLQRHGVPGRCLTLEITETTLMGNRSAAVEVLQKLRLLGVKFSIDDFGTGYSSLAYLGTLPIDSLKIDRSFVMGMQHNAHNVEIVRAVLNLGQTLGKKVIAEGVETAEQLDTLARLGVPVGQGYLLSRPLAAYAVEELLARDRSVA